MENKDWIGSMGDEHVIQSSILLGLKAVIY